MRLIRSLIEYLQRWIARYKVALDYAAAKEQHQRTGEIEWNGETATKADHPHDMSHDRLEAILRALTAKAIARADGVGAEIDVIALAAVRATREAEIRHEGETLDAIIGVPEAGEKIGGTTFDGVVEAAVFPGELPADPMAIFKGDAVALPEADNDWRFVLFRPPLTARGQPAPQIRLDRALQFLIGDRLA